MTSRTPLLLALLLSLPLFAQNADLRITGEAEAIGKVRIGDIVELRVTVENLGPGSADNTRATVTVPAGMTLHSVHVTPPFAATCTNDPVSATCNFGNLSTVSRTMFVNVRMPVEVGTFGVTSTVTSDTPDPSPGNNTAVTNIETENRIQYWVYITPVISRVEPGAAVKLEARLTSYPASLPGTRFTLDIRSINGTIETIESENWQCTIDGTRAECTIAAPSSNCCIDEPVQITMRTNDDPRGGEARLTIDATADAPGEFFETAQAIVEIFRHILVTSTADSGEGTLRAAFEDVNASCAETPCRIDFALPGPVPSEGWFTIVPETPLPPLRAARVTLDGTTQTALTGDTNPKGPEVAIDGHLAGEGIEVHAHCQGAVRGLALGHFHRNQALWLTHDRRQCIERPLQFEDRYEISGNHIGVDPTGTVAWPNLRGLRLDDAGRVDVRKNVISRNTYSGVWMWRGSAAFRENWIQHNGASGIFFGPEVQFGEVLANVIDGHPHMGVAVARGANQVDIRQNSMRDNLGLGIDWGLDGMNAQVEDDRGGAPNAPVLLSAVYDPAADATRVTMTLRSLPLVATFHNWLIDVYTNDAPDGDGDRFVREERLQTLPNELVVTVPGNHEGKWINATLTRVQFSVFLRDGAPSTNGFAGGHTTTSELSNAVLVTR
jgi:uncharacterized repeat protein (TIGR01451 family)